jgi:hypothetical protein
MQLFHPWREEIWLDSGREVGMGEQEDFEKWRRARDAEKHGDVGLWWVVDDICGLARATIVSLGYLH